MNHPNNPFGLLAFLHWNHEWNNWHFKEPILSQALDQLSELGVGMIRMDILWSDIHRGLHQYDFTRYDELIPKIKNKGIEILALLHYNKVHSDKNGEAWNKPPDSLDEFSRYAEETVNRYRHSIRYWEIWNEPNHPIYWAAPPDKLQLYSTLLRTTYKSIKNADPHAIVLNGGLAHPIAESLDYLYSAGGKEFMDIVSIHPFIDPLSAHPDQEFRRIMENVLSVMAQYADSDKKIWITEMGCPGIPEANLLNVNWFQGKGVSEQQQADWLEKQSQLMKEFPSIQKMFWAFYRDTNGIFKDGTDYLGLVDFNLMPKPSFFAFKRLIAESAQKWG